MRISDWSSDVCSSDLKDDGYSDAGIDSGMGSGMGSGTGIGDGSLSLDPREDGNASVTLQVEGDRVGVSAVDETNTLLVRTTTRSEERRVGKECASPC